MRNICCLFNYASHYRYPIYSEIEREFNADFYFGDRQPFKLKKFEVSKLSRFKGWLKNIFFGPFVYTKGLIKVVAKTNYDYYIITGEIKNFSV